MLYLYVVIAGMPNVSVVIFFTIWSSVAVTRAMPGSIPKLMSTAVMAPS